MAATAQTIWSLPAYLPDLQPPLTDTMLADAEAKIGQALPKEYVDLLRVQNGGYIRYELPGRLNESIFGIGPGYPCLVAVEWDEAQENVSFPLQGLYPFDGDGHWNLCLDYRKTPNAPTVQYVDVECDSQTRVAGSFAEYLSMLRVKVRDDEYVVEGGGDIEAIKSALLSAGLKVKFNPPDFYSQGYAIHTARYGDGWINLSPNTVPRGFVRTDHYRYNELKDLLPGEASRYPEAPADSCIMLLAGQGTKKTLAAFEKSGMHVRRLADCLKE